MGFFLVANCKLTCQVRCLGLESVATIVLYLNFLYRKFYKFIQYQNINIYNKKQRYILNIDLIFS